jgi:hypothetical protein
LATKARRVVRGLVGGCALLLGVAVAGCGAPQYTYVANSGADTYFKVPFGWHQISAASLKKVTGSSSGVWTVAYQAGSRPSASDLLSFDTSQPFVFSEIGTLSSPGMNELSYDSLRDFFLPVTSNARSTASSEGFPYTGFSQIRDQVLTPGQGVHGVRETFDYTDKGVTDTFDEIALTNPDQTKVYFIVLHCTSSCYSSDKTEINDVMSSFTIRSP